MSTISQETNDTRFKRYESSIERILSSFETISEWADLISFLSRLHKTLTSNPQFTAIPKKLILTKRLAQCLNPNLPSGVHQKTLEVYGVIFQKIGPEVLLEDLAIFSLGLFSFFENASSGIRIEYLNLMSRYFVPLCSRMGESLQALILAILPGLEEESGEHFRRSLQVLTDIVNIIGQKKMNHRIWQSLIFSSRCRLSSVNYLNKIYPKKIEPDQFSEFSAGSSMLLVTALCNSLEDHNSLVIRGLLDLVICHLPIDNSFLEHEAKIKLAAAILSTLVRRDMSLNRRVFLWILGSAGSESEQSSLSQPIASVLVDSIGFILKKYRPASIDKMSIPFKILVYLNDRYIIIKSMFGNNLLKLIFSEINYYRSLGNEKTEKVMLFINQFFTVADLKMVWNSIYDISIPKDGLLQRENIDSVVFATKTFNICDNEASYKFMPDFLEQVITKIQHQNHPENLILFSSLITSILPRIMLQSSLNAAGENDPARIKTNFSRIDMANSFISCFESLLDHPDLNREDFVILSDGLTCLLLNINQDELDSAVKEQFLIKVFHFLIRVEDATIFFVLCSFVFRAHFHCHDYAENISFINHLLVKIADLMKVIYTDIYVEADQFFSERITVSINNNEVDFLRNFTQFWCYFNQNDVNFFFLPKAITILIGALTEDDSSNTRHVIVNWYSQSSKFIGIILEPILRFSLEVLRLIEEPSLTHVPFYSRTFDTDQILYSIKLIKKLISCSGSEHIENMNKLRFRPEFLDLLALNMPTRYMTRESPNGGASIFQSILMIAIAFGCTEGLNSFEQHHNNNIDSIQLEALQLSSQVISLSQKSKYEQFVYESIVGKLYYMYQTSNYKTFHQCLRILDFVLKKHIDSDSEENQNGLYLDIGLIFDIVSKILQSTLDLEILRCWSEYICSSFSFSYPEFLEKLVTPTCDLLLNKFDTWESTISTSDDLYEQKAKDCLAVLTHFSHIIICIGFNPTKFQSEAETIKYELKINSLTLLLNRLFDVMSDFSIKHHPFRTHLFPICQKLYETNPLTTFYYMVVNFSKEIETFSDTKFIVKTGYIWMLNFESGPFAQNLGDLIFWVLKNVKDPKSEFKQHLESLCTVLYHVFSPLSERFFEPCIAILLYVSKEISSNLAKYKSVIYLFFAYCSLLSSMLPENMDKDQSGTKEFIDILNKILEYVIPLISKAYDFGLWSTGSLNISLTDLDLLTSLAKDKTLGKAYIGIVRCLFPHLHQLVTDNEKIQTHLSSILNHLIIPHLKSGRESINRQISLNSIKHLCQNSNLSRFWRKELWDGIFVDSNFFSCDFDFLKLFGNQVKLYVASDPEKFYEILNKIPSSGSSNLFLSKEMELINRASMIRRLSFLSISCEVDLMRHNLPEMQEKIVDMIRLGIGYTSYEIFFLLRILLVRLGDLPSTLLPVIFTEIFIALNNLRDSKAKSNLNPQYVPTLIQICKFLDCAFIKSDVSFFIYLWMMVSGDHHTGQIDLFSSIAETLGTPADTVVPQHVKDKISDRRPLVPMTSDSNITILGDFFKYSFFRIAEFTAFERPFPEEEIVDSIFNEFTSPFKTDLSL